MSGGLDLPARLDDVVASLGDAVILVDAQDRILLLNHAAQELTGVSEVHAVGRDCAEIFGTTPVIGEILRRTREVGQSQARSEERLVSGRREIPVRMSCSPVWGRGGHLDGFALILQDLSYQRKLEDEARRNENLARLGGLVAGLAHEVKNPLGGIRGAAQLLQRRLGNDPEVAQYTSVMIRETDRLTRLVEELLTLGAPAPPDLQPVSIHQILREVCDLIRPELEARRVALWLAIDPSLPDVLGDAGQLTQLLLNLLRNAWEAMAEGGRMTIRTKMDLDYHILRPAARGKFLRFEVADTGPGFPPESLERVFEPFFTRKVRGTGLGLAICERIVLVHGGSITAENLPSGGALVAVSLPVAA